MPSGVSQSARRRPCRLPAAASRRRAGPLGARWPGVPPAPSSPISVKSGIISALRSRRGSSEDRDARRSPRRRNRPRLTLVSSAVPPGGQQHPAGARGLQRGGAASACSAYSWSLEQRQATLRAAGREGLGAERPASAACAEDRSRSRRPGTGWRRTTTARCARPPGRARPGTASAARPRRQVASDRPAAPRTPANAAPAAGRRPAAPGRGSRTRSRSARFGNSLTPVIGSRRWAEVVRALRPGGGDQLGDQARVKRALLRRRPARSAESRPGGAGRAHR